MKPMNEGHLAILRRHMVEMIAKWKQAISEMEDKLGRVPNLEELSRHMKMSIKKVRINLNPKLEIEGLLRTMYDPRNTLAQNVAAELERHFGDKLYRTVVPRNIRLAEAPSHGVPALKLEEKSKGALAYLALAGEMLRRQEARGPERDASVMAPY